MGTTLRALLETQEPRLRAVAELLETLSAADQKTHLLQLNQARMEELWALAAEAEALEVRDLFPERPLENTTYIWNGVNSLPLFRCFQKRFYYSADYAKAEDRGLLAPGFNEQTFRWFTGPGCFTARAASETDPGPMVFDYTLTPTIQPADWPKVKAADRGISRFVYGGMHDYMRRLTADTMVGKAWVRGRETPNLFVLCRDARG